MPIMRTLDGNAVITRRAGLGLAALALAGGLGLGLPTRPALAQAKPALVFAAASLKNALDEIARQYEKETGKKVTISYGASSALAKQIEAAAPADLFISADLDWMDYLQTRKLIKMDTRGNMLGNRLVLVAPKDSKASIKIGPGLPLVELLGGGRLAMADPKAVPAGKYGRAALESLGVWQAVEPRVASAENVRAALALVSRGEAPLGIVYQTDAAADPHVKIVSTFPEDTHPPIIYPAALTGTSTNGDAAAFLAYMRAPGARPAWEKQGFTVLSK
jgi:molybdate transport system substrate-binding protein